MFITKGREVKTSKHDLKTKGSVEASQF